MPVFRVEKNMNYTTMSNYHLRDKSLSLKSKGLLSMMLSLPEDWNYTMAGLAYICKDGREAIRAAVVELENSGYITREQGRDERGRLSKNIYVIYEQPQKPLSDKPLSDKPLTENPLADKLPTDKPLTDFTPEININKQIKEKQKTDVINQSIYQADSIDTIDVYRKIILDNIDYDIICGNYERERLDEIVEIMLECICSNSDTIRIAKENIPKEIVKSRFLKINAEHIGYVIDCINANTKKVYLSSKK